MEQIQIKSLDKNQLAYYPFSKKEVLTNKADMELRQYDLERAQQLGNLHKHSVTIFFKNTLGETVRVKGSVWALTSKYVQLKGNMTIPILAIEQVIV